MINDYSGYRKMRLSAALAGVALVAASCGGSSGSAGKTSAPSEFSYLTNAENTTVRTGLETLAKGECKAENAALPLKVDTVPQLNLEQKLQLLGGQDALPVQFAAGSPTLTNQFYRSGKIVDLEATLKERGVYDQLEPGAVSLIKALYDGKLEVLPYEYNIEGIFYNKKIFAEHGLTEPKTWDEMVATAGKLKAAGVQPFAASGQQGWPITRLIGAYIYRDLGPDAMRAVADGKAKVTDPEYVVAAQKVADLGKAGYFGEGVGSIDYDTATNQFLSGKAGMFYMGSWALAGIADKTKDKVGADNIGFIPFPAVTGGKGSIDQYTANVGLPMTIGKVNFDSKVGDWLTCIAKNYGSVALKDQGVISGFKPRTPVADPNKLTTQVRGTISGTKQTILWFEALFSPKATTASTTNAAPLVTGSLSAQQFMAKVQDALSNGG